MKNDMSLDKFIKVLKFLKIQQDKNVRILGGEPLLSKNIRSFLQLSLKGGFNIIIFSNINIPNKKIKEIFDGISFHGELRINCNINSRDFYSKEEYDNIKINLRYFKEIGIQLILGYNIYNLQQEAESIFELASENAISAINLKITNSSLGEKRIIDTSDRKLGIYIFHLIKKYHERFFLEFSCGLDKNIFTEEELSFIQNRTHIKLKFGCEGNIGKFDINTNGSIFKCFPLQVLYKNSPLTIEGVLSKNISVDNINSYLTSTFFGLVKTHGECSAHKR